MPILIDMAMNVLLISDHNQTTSALQFLLTPMSQVHFSYHSTTEAQRVIQQKYRSVQLLILDQPGEELLQTLATFTELSGPAVLVLHSDYSWFDLRTIQKKYSFIDKISKKPLQSKHIFGAISNAFKNKAAKRSNWLVYDPGRRICAFGPISTPYASVEEFYEDAKKALPQLTGIIFYPDDSIVAPLKEIRKIPGAAALPLLCASRNPDLIFPFRMICQGFYEASMKELHWCEMMGRWTERAASMWQIEHHTYEMKAATLRRDQETATLEARKLLAIDPCDTQALSLLADQSSPDESEALYQQSLRINPCQPRPYLKLLQCFSTCPRSVAEDAILYCPKNKDVLTAVATYWLHHKQIHECEGVISRLLKLDPSHAEAHQCLKKLEETLLAPRRETA